MKGNGRPFNVRDIGIGGISHGVGERGKTGKKKGGFSDDAPKPETKQIGKPPKKFN